MDSKTNYEFRSTFYDKMKDQKHLYEKDQKHLYETPLIK